MTGSRRHIPTGRAVNRPRADDEGSALIFALVFVVLGSLLLMPMLSFASSVLKSSNVQRAKANRAEVVRGALRVALADPSGLYVACSPSGLTVAVTLAAPNLGVPVHTECTTLASATELDSSELRIPMATVQAGALWPVGTVGTPYANSGNADVNLWIADTTATSTGGKIFLPPLPSHALSHPSAAGYMMPSWAGSCRVFFPGTYTDPVVINTAVPTFFTSGVYYFENTVTFSGAANAVIGEGAIEACTTNAEAAFYAIGAPTSISISGIGATFVLGGAGRLVVTDGGSTVGPTVKFNARLVDPTDVGTAVSQGVSIVTVNGVQAGATASTELYLAGQLRVPKSLTETNPNDATAPVDAASAGYQPSTLVPTVLPAPPALPVIDITLTGTGASTLYVPGYVGVPQGTVNMTVGVGMGPAKSVELLGGVLAANFTQTADVPADTQMGMVNRVVQKTFKIVSQTTSGNPRVVSIAIVQVNDFGEFAINSWVTTTA